MSPRLHCDQFASESIVVSFVFTCMFNIEIMKLNRSSPVQLRADMHLHKVSLRSNIEVLEPVRDGVGAIIGVHIRFTAIKHAILAAAVFEGVKYRGSSIKWGGDPCEEILTEDGEVVLSCEAVVAATDGDHSGAEVGNVTGQEHADAGQAGQTVNEHGAVAVEDTSASSGQAEATADDSEPATVRNGDVTAEVGGKVEETYACVEARELADSNRESSVGLASKTATDTVKSAEEDADVEAVDAGEKSEITESMTLTRDAHSAEDLRLTLKDLEEYSTDSEDIMQMTTTEYLQGLFECFEGFAEQEAAVRHSGDTEKLLDEHLLCTSEVGRPV